VAFVRRARDIRNGDLEVPDDFLNEIHKWSLECEYWVILPLYISMTYVTMPSVAQTTQCRVAGSLANHSQRECGRKPWWPNLR
jgi:hypothetical protein